MSFYYEYIETGVIATKKGILLSLSIPLREEPLLVTWRPMHYTYGPCSRPAPALRDICHSYIYQNYRCWLRVPNCRQCDVSRTPLSSRTSVPRFELHPQWPTAMYKAKREEHSTWFTWLFTSLSALVTILCVYIVYIILTSFHTFFRQPWHYCVRRKLPVRQCRTRSPSDTNSWPRTIRSTSISSDWYGFWRTQDSYCRTSTQIRETLVTCCVPLRHLCHTTRQTYCLLLQLHVTTKFCSIVFS